MFTEAEHDSRAGALRELPLVGCEEVFVEQPDWEACGLVVRGAKVNFRDTVHFWVNAVRTAGLRDVPWGASGEPEFLPITEEGFAQRLNVCWSGAWCRLTLEPKSAFVSAMSVYGSMSDVGTVAEFGSEFVAVFWYTSL